MRATRPKKLTPKQPIPIFREDQIDLTEDDPQTTLQAIETGVEKAEETVSVPEIEIFKGLPGRRHVILGGKSNLYRQVKWMKKTG